VCYTIKNKLYKHFNPPSHKGSIGITSDENGPVVFESTENT